MICSARMPLCLNFGQKNEQNLFFVFRPFYYRALQSRALHFSFEIQEVVSPCKQASDFLYYKPKERWIKRKIRLKIEFSRGSSRLSTKTSLFSMISVEGDFVRTWWYKRRRIRHKARKYRCFGGFKRNHSWLSAATKGDKSAYPIKERP